MTLGELKKLKSLLISQKKEQDNYIIVNDYNEIFLKREKFFGLKYTLEDIKKLEDTTGMVKKCENLLKKNTHMLVNNVNDELNKVVLYSTTGVIFKSKYIDNIVDSFKENPTQVDEDLFTPKFLNENVLNKYAFLDFYLSADNTSIGKCNNLYDYFYSGDANKEQLGKYLINNTKDNEASGIVNYEEFVKKITDLGYDVKFVSDYNKKIQNNNSQVFSKEFGTINIIADLTIKKTKKKQ